MTGIMICCLCVTLISLSLSAVHRAAAPLAPQYFAGPAYSARKGQFSCGRNVVQTRRCKRCVYGSEWGGVNGVCKVCSVRLMQERSSTCTWNCTGTALLPLSSEQRDWRTRRLRCPLVASTQHATTQPNRPGLSPDLNPNPQPRACATRGRAAQQQPPG